MLEKSTLRVMITLIAFVGDMLRDVVDPRLRSMV